MKKLFLIVAFAIAYTTSFSQEKYSLVKADFSPVTYVDSTDTYKVGVTISIHPNDGIAPNFSKDIVVFLTKVMTIEAAVNKCKMSVVEYLSEINN